MNKVKKATSVILLMLFVLPLIPLGAADACDSCINVTGVSGVPGVASAGLPVTLAGTVEPRDSTRKDIEWSVQNAGSTGASIAVSADGAQILNTTSPGTATLWATVRNGRGEGSDYVQQFTISVNNAPFTSVTGITGVPSLVTAWAPTRLGNFVSISPSDATYRVINWEVIGGEASIHGDLLVAEGENGSTVKLRATIENGISAGSNYMQEFDIQVTTSSFIPVYEITGLHTILGVGRPYTFDAAVFPLTATNRTISWALLSPGDVSYINVGNIWLAFTPGTMKFRATVRNGRAPGVDYVEDFDLEFMPFLPVTSITGVPTAGVPGTPLSLTGSAIPLTATNRTPIHWTVADAGTTGALIASGSSILTTTNEGTVTVKALIESGSTAPVFNSPFLLPGVDYIQFFSITISSDPEQPPPPPPPPPAGSGGTEVSNTTGAEPGAPSIPYLLNGNNAIAQLGAGNIQRMITGALNNTAVVNFSAVSGVVRATLPGSAMNQFAAASLGVEVRLPAGALAFDNDSLKSALSQAGSTNLTVSLTPAAVDTMPEAQKQNIREGDAIFSITVAAGSQRITGFDGSLTATLPYDGKLPAAVYHVSADGKLERMGSTFNAATKSVKFETSSLSYFVVREGVQPQVMQPKYPAHTRVEGRASANTLILDGVETDFPALSIDWFNWLRLRDIAVLLSGTGKSFSIDWDGATGTVSITTGGSYEGELLPLQPGELTVFSSAQKLMVDGQLIEIAAFKTGGHNYYRLRDIAILLDFSVTFSGNTVTLNLDAPYSE